MSRIGRSLAFAVAAVAAVATATWALAPKEPSARDRWGVEELRVVRSANGHLLDFRYRVVDPERARSLLSEDGPAYLVHARSGRRLAVPSTPKAGRLRTVGTPQAGRSYFALFANPGRLVRSGDQVSVVLGDLTAELIVE